MNYGPRVMNHGIMVQLSGNMVSWSRCQEPWYHGSRIRNHSIMVHVSGTIVSPSTSQEPRYHCPHIRNQSITIHASGTKLSWSMVSLSTCQEPDASIVVIFCFLSVVHPGWSKRCQKVLGTQKSQIKLLTHQAWENFWSNFLQIFLYVSPIGP